MAEINEAGGTSTTTLICSLATNHPPSDEFVVLREGKGAESVAKLQAESLSTIAVIVDGEGFHPGRIVEADYGGATMPATVKSADEQPDGSWLVVLQWGQ